MGKKRKIGLFWYCEIVVKILPQLMSLHDNETGDNNNSKVFIYKTDLKWWFERDDLKWWFEREGQVSYKVNVKV